MEGMTRGRLRRLYRRHLGRLQPCTTAGFGAADRIEERVEVDFAGPEIHDAGAKHEPPVQLGAGQKHLPGGLDRLENVPVQTIDIGIRRRRRRRANTENRSR